MIGLRGGCYWLKDMYVGFSGALHPLPVPSDNPGHPEFRTRYKDHISGRFTILVPVRRFIVHPLPSFY